MNAGVLCLRVHVGRQACLHMPVCVGARVGMWACAGVLACACMCICACGHVPGEEHQLQAVVTADSQVMLLEMVSKKHVFSWEGEEEWSFSVEVAEKNGLVT